MELNGVFVTITKSENYPTPFGLNYKAKGAYRQGKNIVVVGKIALVTESCVDNTMRVKYPAKDVELKFF